MSLTSIEEIERAIGSLSRREVEELFAWLDHHYPQTIDAQLKADLEAGRIDGRINRALADHNAGKTRPL